MSRTLHFPNDRSSGSLKAVGPEGTDVEARGDVDVPDGVLVALVAVLGTDAGPSDLSGLTHLRPDDLAGLAATGLNGGQLAAVAHLTGLHQVTSSSRGAFDGGPPIGASEISVSGDALDGDAVVRLATRSPAVSTLSARGGATSASTPAAAVALRWARPDLALDGAVLSPAALE